MVKDLLGLVEFPTSLLTVNSKRHNNARKLLREHGELLSQAFRQRPVKRRISAMSILDLGSANVNDTIKEASYETVQGAISYLSVLKRLHNVLAQHNYFEIVVSE